MDRILDIKTIVEEKLLYFAPSTLRKMAETGKIPMKRIDGGKWEILESRLYRWMEKRYGKDRMDQRQSLRKSPGKRKKIQATAEGDHFEVRGGRLVKKI
jgi:hypothetical protein